MKCKYCHSIITNSIHVRWCKLNPNLDNNKKTLSEKIKIGASERVKKAHLEGKYKNAKYNRVGRKQTEITKNKLREIALKSKHRRLVRSTRPYKDINGNIILLDSSWEEALAKRLDEQKILWVRPVTPIEWIDGNNIVHNYFPDFFLPEHNLYLDPKNPAAYMNQIEKIKILLNKMKNLIILKTLEECKQFTVVDRVTGVCAFESRRVYHFQ